MAEAIFAEKSLTTIFMDRWLSKLVAFQKKNAVMGHDRQFC